MTLQQTLDADYKAAFKAHDTASVETYRMVKSAVKNAEIEARHELSDEETISVLQREVKRRRESALAFRDGGREELAAKEDAEIALIAKYLPEQMSDDELTKIVETIISEQSATAKDFGKVMGAVMASVKGKADGSRVTPIVKQLLK
jgi:uncharacterized protein YqeY